MTDEQQLTPEEQRTLEGLGMMVPQGLARPDPKISTPADKTGLNSPDLMGRLSNIASTGIAGAQLGAAAGPMGALTGGAGGAALGALMTPSETPGTDLGATVASTAASFIPGGKLAKTVYGVGSTAAGAYLGSKADQEAGLIQETPLGKIGIYSLAALAGHILASPGANASPTQTAATDLEKMTQGGMTRGAGGQFAGRAPGVQMPLNTAEATGKFGTLTSMLGRGTPGYKALGADQSAAAEAAFSKIVGAPLSKAVGTILEGTEIKDTTNAVVDAWKAAQVSTNIGGKAVRQTGPKAFQSAFNLTSQEFEEFTKAVGANPERFIDQLVPKGGNQINGLIKLRAVMKVLEGSGEDVAAAKLGQSVIMRDLAPAFQGVAVDGKKFSKLVAFSAEHMKVALRSDQIKGLETLATVLEEVNPIKKMIDGGSQISKSLGYTAQKLGFGSLSMGAGIAAGTAVGSGNVAGFVIGASTAAAVFISLEHAVGSILMNPKNAQLLLAANKGSATAANTLVRNIMYSEKTNKVVETGKEALGKFSGLFR